MYDLSKIKEYKLFITAGIGVGLTLKYLFKKYNNKNYIDLIKNIPICNQIISSKMKEIVRSIENDILIPMEGIEDIYELPEKGWEENKILERIELLKKNDKYDWDGGKVSGTVYYSSEDHNRLLQQSENIFYWSNPLHTDIFPGIRKMEAEIISMVNNMMNGPEVANGIFTCGGTESIILAVKAHRDYYRETRKIYNPNIIVYDSAHCAFDKACDLMNIEIRKINSNEQDVKILEDKIDKNTILLVGSSPSFPHGFIDNICLLNIIARKYNIGLHIDACLGGFLTFIDRKIDFSLNNVTSISVDTHKYGYCPKGSSVVLFRDKYLRESAYFIYPNASIGVYATSNITGSRPGNIIAATWASLMYFGKDGYKKSAELIGETLLNIENELKNDNRITILPNSKVNIIGITSDIFDIYEIADGMNNKGWNLNMLQNPKSIHLCITLQHVYAEVKDKFIKDMFSVLDELEIQLQSNNNVKSKKAALYGSMLEINESQISGDILKEYLNTILHV